MQVFENLFSAYPLILQVIQLILAIVVASIATFFILRIERKVANRLWEKKKNINLRFVENMSRFVLIFIAVQWVVMSSSLTQSFGRVLFQGTAVIAAIAGFAAQPIIADIICGLMLSATKSFNIGDRIELEDGTAGAVKDMTLRHVVIVGIDTAQIIIPNSKLHSMKIVNMTAEPGIRSMLFRFHVAYDTDVSRAKAVIAKAIRDSAYSIPGKKVGAGREYGPVYFLEYASSSLVMGVTVYFEASHPSEVIKNDINTRVKQALNDNQIEIPYDYINVVMNGRG